MAGTKKPDQATARHHGQGSGMFVYTLAWIPLLILGGILFAKMGVRDGTNFNHWGWTWGRFFELWWLWLTLPVSGGLFSFAAMRNTGPKRPLILIHLLFVFCLSVALGVSYWRDWP